MRLSYRKELEKAARRMILIHRTDTLIRLIIRTIVRNLKASYAGIFLYRQDKKAYILTISGGRIGMKIPAGLVKLSPSSHLVKFFLDSFYRLDGNNYLIVKKIKGWLRRKKVKENSRYKKFFTELVQQLSSVKAEVALPIFFRDELLGILILGEKLSKRKFLPEELTFLSILSSDVAMAIRNASLFENLRLQLEKNQKLFLQTISALAEAIEAKDKYTIGHTERVVDLSLKIAYQLRKMRKIKNWDKFERDLKVAALLHDIGKIGVPETVLNKPASLTEEEWSFVKKHPLIGVEILSPIKDLKEVISAIKYHHERYDGRGYPEGIKGKKIPLIAAIIAVADAYDAMTSDRPYRKALPPDQAKQEIKKNKGFQFHPQVVEAFLRAFSNGR
ncbi:MAG: hypothetical protein B6D55_04000 [Candidatus Omnitrophica bacterium 4484_70.2]|nr:MAG: hypothetical protein B6D55_04000 [Candidatus Omnitrophica bacterium 4484_70.2]